MSIAYEVYKELRDKSRDANGTFVGLVAFNIPRQSDIVRKRKNQYCTAYHFSDGSVFQVWNARSFHVSVRLYCFSCCVKDENGFHIVDGII